MRAALWGFAILAACSEGISPGSGGQSPVDAAKSGGGGSNNPITSGGVDAAKQAVPDAGNGCDPQVPSDQLGNGEHNPGQDCMNGCHDHGFTFAGTVFTSATSSTPFTGATVVVVDADNQIVSAQSQLNGNFFSTIAVKFPLTVLATSCPTVDHMTATVAGSGSAVGCNQTGCHTSGNWIHIP
jgi:hypothetical protein